MERALDHPTRRAILDLLSGEEELGSKAIAEKLGIPVGNIDYHVEVLTICDAAEGVQGGRGERAVRLPRPAPPSKKNRVVASDSMRDDISEDQLKSLIEMAAHLRPGHAPGTSAS